MAGRFRGNLRDRIKAIGLIREARASGLRDQGEILKYVANGMGATDAAAPEWPEIMAFIMMVFEFLMKFFSDEDDE